jgi:tetratricopeptide (TPR) repeat protein
MSNKRRNTAGPADAEKENADDFFKSGNFAEADAAYRRVIELDPGFAEGYANLGVIALQDHRLDEAENRLMDAIRRNPRLVEAHFNLGCLLQEKREFEKALSFFKETVNLKPHDVKTWIRMGFCAKSLERPDDALAFFKEAFRRKPNSLEAGAALSGLHVERGDAEQAAEVIRISLVSIK